MKVVVIAGFASLEAILLQLAFDGADRVHLKGGVAHGMRTCQLRAPNMQDTEFPRIVALICKEDTRFDRKAYDFVRLGLDHTVKEIRKKDSSRSGKSRHVTGPELLDGLRVYALEQFGPLTKTVLNSWGVRSCKDFGDIVFNLIDYNAFSKTENDRREDFANLYEFDDVFVKPFLPTQRPRGASAAEAVGSA